MRGHRNPYWLTKIDHTDIQHDLKLNILNDVAGSDSQCVMNWDNTRAETGLPKRQLRHEGHWYVLLKQLSHQALVQFSPLRLVIRDKTRPSNHSVMLRLLGTAQSNYLQQQKMKRQKL